MRLLRCRIDNFGKLTDFSYDFSQGINVIEEENGWGKSTLAAFLKAMLYGFDTKKEAGAIQKERTLYFPWQGGTYGGELDFEVNGRQYRISRTFGKTEKADSFKIYDLSTNLESTDYSESIGEELFDLDRASFKRSMYIAQKDCVSTSSDAINAKLGDLADNTNDINNYETAMTKLKDTLNRLSPTRATGSVKKRESILTQLKMELKGFEDTTEGLHQLKKLYQEKQQEQEQVSLQRQQAANRLKKASEESTRAEQKKQYDSLQQELQDRMQEYQSTKEHFPGEVPSKESLEKALEQAGVLEQTGVTVHNFSLTAEEESVYRILEQKYGNYENIALHDSFDKNIDEQLSHMNQAASIRNQINDLHTKLSVQESLAAQQELMQIDVNMQPQKNAAGIMGIGILTGGVIFALLGLLLGITGGFHGIVPVIVLILGIVFIVVGVIFLKNEKSAAEKQRKQLEEEQIQKQQQRRQEIQRPAEELKMQITQLTAQLQDELVFVKKFLETHNIYCEENACQAQLYELKNVFHKDLTEYQNLFDKRTKTEEAKIRQEQIRSGILSYLSDLRIEPEEDLKKQISNLSIAAETCKLARRNLDQIQERCQQFEKEHDVEILKAVADNCREAGAQYNQEKQLIINNANGQHVDDHKEDYDKEDNDYDQILQNSSLDELNNMISEADQQIESIKQALNQYMNQMNALQEQLDLRDEKEQELNETLEVQQQEKHKFEVLKMTQEYLQQAKEQFTARYMAPISNGFRKYFEMLTGDTQNLWMVDTNISVKVKEQGQLRETELLSAGWQDLIGICMRLALVDAMYQEEKPFLILDDPFVNLDNEKIESGMEMLKKVSREYQTIYFTCHQSRVPE